MAKMNKKYLLFGGSGKLGSELQRIANFIAPPSSEVDITNFEQLESYIDTIKPDVIINAVAIVGAKKCEEEKELAYKLNAEAVYYLSKLCQKKRIKLVHISTDAIFDGDKGDYVEEDFPNPINYYGLSKLAGECFARTADNSLIIRTSFIPTAGFPFPKAFIDQWTCRDTLDKVAADMWLAIRNNLSGIINIAGDKKDTVYNIAKTVSQNVGKITRAETGLNLPRDLSLDTTKWRKLKETLT